VGPAADPRGLRAGHAPARQRLELLALEQQGVRRPLPAVHVDTDEATRLDLATQCSAIQQDDTPIIVAFYITQLRAQKKAVHGITGPGAFYCDVSGAFIAKA